MKWLTARVLIGLWVASTVLTAAVCVALAVWAGGAL